MNVDRVYEARENTQEERTWAMFAHLGAPIGAFVSAGMLGFVIPLVVYFARRDDSEFACDQAKEALNWQFTLFLLWIGGLLAAFLTLGLGLIIVIPMFIVLFLLELVLGIFGGLQAYEGKRYRYPFALRLWT